MLERPVPVGQLPGFDQGSVSVQDGAAQYAVTLMGLHSGQRVLDACAAPGGKTAHMLERGNGLDVLAIDVEPGRVKKMEGDLRRLGLTAQCLCADASRPETWWDGRPFDRILLDAPCSGSGVVRRHPDIKWLRRPEDIPVMAERQRRLLSQLWPLLRRGGRLVYATCSLFKQENADVINHFLETTTGVHQMTVANLLENSSVKEMVPDVGVPVWNQGQLLPDEAHDGFYYAVLQKS